jgi:integrase
LAVVLIRLIITVREAIYVGKFDTPKTEAGVRQVPLSDAAFQLVTEWKALVGHAAPDSLVFATRMGTVISPNNVLGRCILPTCKRLGLPRATWLTFRRTYSSWSHERGVPGKVVAQMMIREAVQKIGDQLFTIVHRAEAPAATVS